jgi:hypothetical protein
MKKAYIKIDREPLREVPRKNAANVLRHARDRNFAMIHRMFTVVEGERIYETTIAGKKYRITTNNK